MNLLRNLAVDPDVAHDSHQGDDKRRHQREPQHPPQDDFIATHRLGDDRVHRAGLDVLRNSPAGKHEDHRQDQPTDRREDEDDVLLDLNVGLLAAARQEPRAEHEEHGENHEDEQDLAAHGFADGERRQGPDPPPRIECQKFRTVPDSLVELAAGRPSGRADPTEASAATVVTIKTRIAMNPTTLTQWLTPWRTSNGSTSKYIIHRQRPDR